MSSIPVSALPVTIEPAWVSVPCAGCEQALLVPAGTVPPLCGGCRKSQAMNEAKRLLGDVEDLIQGRGVFAELRVDERAEQLEALFDEGWVAELPDVQLIDLVGRSGDPGRNVSQKLVARAALEIGVRIQERSGEPDPIERQRIELEDEQQHREATIDREFSQVDESFDGIYA